MSLSEGCSLSQEDWTRERPDAAGAALAAYAAYPTT